MSGAGKYPAKLHRHQNETNMDEKIKEATQRVYDALLASSNSAEQLRIALEILWHDAQLDQMAQTAPRQINVIMEA